MADAREPLLAEVRARFRLLADSREHFRRVLERVAMPRSEVVLLLFDPTLLKGFVDEAAGATPDDLHFAAVDPSQAAELFEDEQLQNAMAAELEPGRVRIACVALGGVTITDSKLDGSPDHVQGLKTSSWRSVFFDPSNLRSLGAEMLPYSFATECDPRKAALGVTERISELTKTDPLRAQPWLEWMGSNDTLGTILWSCKWASCGFPQVAIGARLAASLMATTIDVREIVTVRLPWPTFMIQLPPGILTAIHGGKPVALDAILVHDLGDGTINVMVCSRETGMLLFHPAHTLADLANEAVIADDTHQGAWLHEFEDHDRRALLLEGRLVIGVAAEMTAPEHVESVSRGPGGKSRRSGPPRAWTFEIRRDVRVDVRPAVRDYLEGRRSGSPKVQSLVRGHWKHQPHGPDGCLRKLIHVEPYWRGPEDSPIALRSHVMPAREDTAS